VFLNDIGGSRKGEKMCKMTQEVGSQKCKGQMQCEQSMNLGAFRLKIMFETNSRRIEYEYGNSATDYCG
jgi:hypothetical protein